MAREQIVYSIKNSKLGNVLVAESEKGVCCVTIEDGKTDLVSDLQRRFPKADIVEAKGKYSAMVVEFVKNPAANADFPLDIRGTDFQKKVWNALLKIPAGKTSNYSEIAEKIKSPSAVRAVAGACAANSLAVVVPCHRVLTKSGKISGYRWGVGCKEQLLKMEGAL